MRARANFRIMKVRAIDHVQLAMPPGREAEARAFYTGLLQIPMSSPNLLISPRAGCWFERGARKIHLGVEKEFAPARKAHPALVIEDLPALADALKARGMRRRRRRSARGLRQSLCG